MERAYSQIKEQTVTVASIWQGRRNTEAEMVFDRYFQLRKYPLMSGTVIRQNKSFFDGYVLTQRVSLYLGDV